MTGAFNIASGYLIGLLMVFFSSVCIAGDYDTSYCHNPFELQKWKQMLTNDPDSEPLTAIHALWIGLCVKVEARQLTTLKANQLFEQFRDALVEQMKQQRQPDPLGEKS